MFNPLYPFTNDVLEATIKRGCTFFVRNTYPNALDHFDESIKGYFIITHYDDEAKARAHFNSIVGDAYRHIYNWSDPQQQRAILVIHFLHSAECHRQDRCDAQGRPPQPPGSPSGQGGQPGRVAGILSSPSPQTTTGIGSIMGKVTACRSCWGGTTIRNGSTPRRH